jgi:hypothetical protein
VHHAIPITVRFAFLGFVIELSFLYLLLFCLFKVGESKLWENIDHYFFPVFMEGQCVSGFIKTCLFCNIRIY